MDDSDPDIAQKLKGGALAGCPLCATFYPHCLLRERQKTEKCLVHGFGRGKRFGNPVVQQDENS